MAFARAARFYVRYFPFNVFKKALWARISWRSYPYKARTKFGALMSGVSSDAVQGRIYHFGIWEPNLTSFLIGRLSGQRGRTFIDVGANVGYFSILAGKMMPEGSVVSIEAYPSIFQKLKGNVESNHLENVRLVQCAATAQAGSIEIFHAGEKNEGATTTVKGRVNSSPLYVHGLPLFQILSESEIDTALIIKIDVEGAELSVIDGMKEMLDRFRDDVEIVVEISPSSTGDQSAAEILDIFSRFGYYPYELANSYLDSAYLNPSDIVRPRRVINPLSQQTDIVFSKLDREFL